MSSYNSNRLSKTRKIGVKNTLNKGSKPADHGLLGDPSLAAIASICLTASAGVLYNLNPPPTVSQPAQSANLPDQNVFGMRFDTSPQIKSPYSPFLPPFRLNHANFSKKITPASQPAIYNLIRNSFVGISITFPDDIRQHGASCSGWLFDSHTVVTAAHCLRCPEQVEHIPFKTCHSEDLKLIYIDAFPPGQSLQFPQAIYSAYSGKSLGVALSDEYDVAVIHSDLEILPNTNALTIAKNFTPPEQLIIGHFLGYGADTDWQVEQSDSYKNFKSIAVNTVIQKGNSGSAVFNTAGEVVGVVARINQDKTCLADPVTPELITDLVAKAVRNMQTAE